jgi:phosphotransferase system IIB component
MGIMNAAVRNAIKVALAKKYLDSLGLKMPSLPQRPKFELPPIPDLASMYSDIANTGNMTGLSELYTEEYRKLASEYNSEMERAKSVYDSKMEDVNSKIERAEANKEDTAGLYAELERIEYEYKKAKSEALAKAGAPGIVKFRELGSKDETKAAKVSGDELKSKKDAAKAAMLEATQLSIVRQYSRYVKKETEVFNRLVDESNKLFNDTKVLYYKSVESITNYFKEDGDGGAWVDRECAKIDRIWDNMSGLFKELSFDMSAMVAKLPNPDVLVAGAAVGVPNPGYKILVFMENFKKVVTDLTKISNYMKEMVDIAKKMGFDIMKAIGVFASMGKLIEALSGDADRQFKNAMTQLKKRTKWSAKVKKTDEDGDENLTKRAGYMYADIEVDYTDKTINLLGYKCYCTKQRDFLDGYVKNGGSFSDEKGKRYYYLKEDDITHAADDYSELDPDEDTGLGETLGAATYDYDRNTTTLQLSDGRVVTIDYLANEGDYIRLNDGTQVHVV